MDAGWSEERRLLGRVGWTTGALFVGVLAGVPVGILAARMLGPSGKGVFDVARYVTLGLTPMVSLGLGAAGVKYSTSGLVTAAEVGKLIRLVAAASLIPAGVLSGVLAAVGVVPPAAGVLTAVSVPAAVVAMQGSDLLRGTRREVRPSGNQIADRILFARSMLTVAVVITAGLLVSQVEVFVAGWVVGWTVAAWLIVRVGGRRIAGKGLDWGTVGRLVRFGVVHHIPVTLGPVFMWIGVVGVGILAGRAEAGIFGTAAAIVDILLLVGVAVRLVGFPWLQGSAVSSSDMAASMSRVATSAVFTVAAVAATIVPWLIPFAYGPAFGESVRIVWWFLPGVVAAVPAVAVTVFLQATDRAGRAAWVWLGAAVGFVVWVVISAGSGGWLVAAGFSVVEILLLVALMRNLEQSESSAGWLVVRVSDLRKLRPSAR